MNFSNDYYTLKNIMKLNEEVNADLKIINLEQNEKKTVLKNSQEKHENQDCMQD